MCHQVVEKMLKAYWTATRDATPDDEEPEQPVEPAE